MGTINDIKYPENQRIIDRMREEITSAFGSDEWDKITCCGCPAVDMDKLQLSMATQSLFAQIDDFTDRQKTKAAITNVKHALRHSDFAWAREKFLQYNDIDLFAEAVYQDSIDILQQCAETKKLFYGQPITHKTLTYLKSIDDLFYGKREGNIITATAIPYMTENYLHAKDDRIKRYNACHCQFARESILTDKPVSETLCYCSLGHTKVFWETALDAKLEGDVLQSALKGDVFCKFAIYLPNSVIEKYVCS